MGNECIALSLRYLRRLTDPEVELREKNLQYAHVRKELPLDQTALIALDIWDRDVLADMRERDDRITRERIVPVIRACRQAGLQIIHAPTREIAARSPNWVNTLEDETPPDRPYPRWENTPIWPPADAQAAAYPPREPRFDAVLRKELDETDFHELVRPEGDEAVVGSGEELHRLCAQRQILHLLYVGFHTPGCMNLRDYGITAMKQRGFHCVLVRDCTNGMEAPEHFDDQTGMKAFIAFFERNWIYTISSDELISAVSRDV